MAENLRVKRSRQAPQGAQPAIGGRLRLREILQRRGLNQKQAAEKLGMSENAIGVLVGRPGRISLDTVAKICVVLRVSPNDLFEVRTE